MTWTPGPWHVNDGGEVSGTVICGGRHEHRKVCTVWTDWQNGQAGIPIEVKKANARLIALAPELAEALKECAECLERSAPAQGRLHEAAVNARALLAKLNPK